MSAVESLFASHAMEEADTVVAGATAIPIFARGCSVA
jgi:hypothetical protein